MASPQACRGFLSLDRCSRAPNPILDYGKLIKLWDTSLAGLDGLKTAEWSNYRQHWQRTSGDCAGFPDGEGLVQ